MNLFKKSPSAVERLDDLVGREAALEDLESCILTRQNTVIMGVEGIGKTSLLKSFFSAAYRRDRAKNHSELIFFADLSKTAGGDELCDYLTNQLFFAVKFLLHDAENYREILEYLKDIKGEEHATAKERFENSVRGLRDLGGYYVFLILDGFEQFTSSLSVTLEHHNMLRALIEAELMRCIVATNFDLNKDSLPQDVSDSLYLQKFQNKIILSPFTLEEAGEFVRRKLKDDPIQFTPAQIAYLHRLSGGIPSVFELASSYAYENIRENGGRLRTKGFNRQLYEIARPTMRRWCKLLSESNMLAILALLDTCRAGYDSSAPKTVPHYFEGESSEIKGAVTRLSDRRVFVEETETDEYGRTGRREGYYKFNSLLLQMFAMSGDLEAAAAKNPLLLETMQKRERSRLEMEELRHQQRMRELEEEKSAVEIERVKAECLKRRAEPQPGPTTNIYGGTFIQGDVNATMVQAVVTPKELLQMLTDSGQSQEKFADALYTRMRGILPAGGVSPIVRTEDMSDADYDGQYDEAFSRQISDHIVGDVAVDEDGGLVDITAQEHATLENRFEEARGIRPDLTDGLLNCLSERCAFYLKLSVVVEQMLNSLKFLHSNDIDCSPQLVLYGKALEQHLRDCLFNLFRSDGTMKKFLIPVNGSRIRFQDAREQQTTIGNYAHCINSNAARLSKLCSAKMLRWNQREQDDAQWEAFWRTLSAAVHAARKIRNKADHASRVSPTYQDIDDICALCFSDAPEKNIFCKLLLGRDL